MIDFNSLAPGKFELNFKYVIFKRISMTDGWSISCEIALIWMWLDFTNHQSTLVQVMAWCQQATSHYLSKCWPRSLSPYGVTRPPWVKVYNCTKILFVQLNCIVLIAKKELGFTSCIHTNNQCLKPLTTPFQWLTYILKVSSAICLWKRSNWESLNVLLEWNFL